MKLDELTLSEDHRAVMVDETWVELSDAIEKIAYIKSGCEACPSSTFLSCIQLDTTERKANCEMLEEAKLFTQMGDAPMPQVGKLYEDYLAKNAPKPVVVEETKPAPAPKSLVDKIKENLKIW